MFWFMTDIIQPQYVGNTLHQVLKILPNFPPSNTNHMETGSGEQFFPLNRNSSHSIELKICRNGPYDIIEAFDQEYYIVLHFKKFT